MGLQTLSHKVKIMKVLDHPNIVKLSEVMDTEETLPCRGVCCRRRDAPSTKGSWQHERETGLRLFLPEDVHQTVLQLDNPPRMLT